jgi:hypothetical protein
MPLTRIPAGSLGAPAVSDLVNSLVDSVNAGLAVPQGGIPAESLSSDVQADLTAGSTAYQLPEGGITTDDLAAGVTASLGKADSALQSGDAYVLPQDGIPSSAMTTAVQDSLAAADSAYELPEDGIPSSDMTTDVQTSLGKADSAYQAPAGGIPAEDLAPGTIPTVTWKPSVADAAALPGVKALVQTVGTTGGVFPHDYTTPFHATAFTGRGRGAYRLQTMPPSEALDPQKVHAAIYSTSSGHPWPNPVSIDADDEVTTTGNGEPIEFEFADADLVEGTTYWLVCSQADPGTLAEKAATTGSTGAYSSNGGSWTTCAPMYLLVYFLEAGAPANTPGDCILQRDLGAIMTWKDAAWTLVSEGGYTKPEDGIPATDLTTEVQASLGLADSATQGGYVKPEGGIPGSDLEDAYLAAADMTWKPSVANAAALPGLLGLIQTVGSTDHMFSANYSDGAYHCTKFTGNGEGHYRLETEFGFESASITFRGFIYTNVAGKPGVQVAQSDADYVAGMAAHERPVFDFADVNLTLGTSYWLVCYRVSGATANLEYAGDGTTLGAYGNDGSTWTLSAPMYLTIHFLAKGAPENELGDCVLERDTDQIMTWDGAEWTVVAPNPVAANVPQSTEVTNPTVTEFNALLTALKTVGLMVADVPS